MPIIESQTPNVKPGFHTLVIEGAELFEGTAYQQPDVPETRVKMFLRVETPNQPATRFEARMSQATSDKATLGSIIRAALNINRVPREFDTDLLIGKRIGHMVTHDDNGWPKLVSGTASPIEDDPPPSTRRGKKTDEQPAATALEEVPWSEGDEPPF